MKAPSSLSSDSVLSDDQSFLNEEDMSGIGAEPTVENSSTSLPYSSLSTQSTLGIKNLNALKGPRKWSVEEDERLRRAVEARGESHWKSIAAEVGSRNHVQCLQRWKKVLRPGLRKGCWTTEEDAMLVRLVARGGFKNWGVLASHMIGRTSKQCRERWQHHLDPSIKRTAYTVEEDAAILLGHAKLGNRWSQIAASVPGRTENSIKARYQLLQRQGFDVHSVRCDSMNRPYLARLKPTQNNPVIEGIAASNCDDGIMDSTFQSTILYNTQIEDTDRLKNEPICQNNFNALQQKNYSFRNLLPHENYGRIQQLHQEKKLYTATSKIWELYLNNQFTTSDPKPVKTNKMESTFGYDPFHSLVTYTYPNLSEQTFFDLYANKGELFRGEHDLLLPKEQYSNFVDEYTNTEKSSSHESNFALSFCLSGEENGDQKKHSTYCSQDIFDMEAFLEDTKYSFIS